MLRKRWIRQTGRTYEGAKRQVTRRSCLLVVRCVRCTRCARCGVSSHRARGVRSARGAVFRDISRGWAYFSCKIGWLMLTGFQQGCKWDVWCRNRDVRVSRLRGDRDWSVETDTRPRCWSDGIETRPRRDVQKNVSRRSSRDWSLGPIQLYNV